MPQIRVKCEKRRGMALSNDLRAAGYRFFAEWRFAKCTSLTSINIPGSVTAIKGNVFSGCKRLTSAAYKGLTCDCAHINDLYKAINGD